MSATITYPSTDNMFADSPKITLDKINQNVGMSGTGATTAIESVIALHRQVYMDRAPADPDDINIPALSFDSTTGAVQQWNVNTLAWS